MATTIPATNVYRAKVAEAAASGGALPAAAEIAFGTGTTGVEPDDVALEAEVHRNALTRATADGSVLQCAGTVTGSETGEPITEVGIFDTDGDLLGRRSFKPKELEAESSLDFTLHFQF